MADHTGSSTLEGSASSGNAPEVVPGGSAAHGNHHGRPVSWVAVTIVCVGFVIGGIAMVPGPKWWLFWTGAGIAIVGCLIMAFARTFESDWY